MIANNKGSKHEMRLLQLFMAAAAATSLIGMTQAHAKTPANTLVVAKQIDDLISLDPAEAYEPTSFEVVGNLYDRLMKFEADDPTKLVGGVAESWAISPDSKTYTFKIRTGLKFESGNPLTAEDVAFSLRRVIALNKGPAFLIGQLGWTPENVTGLITAPDASTLQLTITADLAQSLVLNLLSSVVASVVDSKTVLSHEAGSDLGNAWLRKNSAGSGPFHLIAWKPKESVSMASNPDFRLGAPIMKQVVIRNIPEPSVQMLLLEKGDIDMARDLTTDQLTTLAASPEIKILEAGGPDTVYLAFDQSDEKLKKPQVLEAMRYLVDYQGMADTFLKGRYTIQQSIVPVGFFGALKITDYKLDVEKAKKLLADAGYSDGFDLKIDTFNTSPMPQIAQSLQQTMAKAGINVKIAQADQKQVFTLYRARKHQSVLIPWGPDYLDPHSNTGSFVYNPDNSDAPAEKPVAWRNHWEVPAELSDLMVAASREVDNGKRAALYEELQRKVADTGPYICMFQSARQIAMQKNVNGFVIGMSNDLVFYQKVTK
jgi:peptide/nickel transport system substrate-binding protein